MIVLPPSPWDGDTPEPRSLLAEVVAVAESQVGVRETRGWPNRGPQVDEYLRSVGIDPETGAFSWCASFVHWCYQTAASNVGVANPCPRTGRVIGVEGGRNPLKGLWVSSPLSARVLGHDARDNPKLIRPGAIYIADHGGGKGHAGIVVEVAPSTVHTIEGNTNVHGSREGDGVLYRDRLIASALGFLDFGG